MAGNMMTSDENWRTPLFRNNMVTKIEEAILHCGAPTNKNAVEMESQVFSKAKSKEEYLGFVARLIIHIKEMGPKPKIPSGPVGMNNQQPQPPVGGQMSGGQQNMGMMGPMGSINQMGMMHQSSMVQIQQGMVQQGINQQQGNLMGGMSQQQQQQQMQQQQQIQQQQMQQQQMQQQQQIQQQQLQQQMQHQQQQQQQNAQQPQMMNQGFMGQQPMQNPQMQQSVPMQGQQIPSPQVQMQIQSPQLQGMLPNQQSQQILQGRGMVNPNQMAQNRIMVPQQTMASQLTQMAAQQQLRKRATIGSNAMGMPRPELGPNYPMNRCLYYPSSISQQVENVNMVGQYQGPGPQQIPQRVNQFIPPNTSQGMSVAAVPSPTSMPVPGQVGPSPSYGNSPGSSTIMHSPVGPGMNVNNLRPYPNQIPGVPSPNPTLNTPLSVAATPSPRNADDQACFEKIRELKKYTDLLQRMIAKIGNEDVEKSSKMKKLLEILTSPNQRVSMEILLKCEAALKKMERQQHDAGGLLGPAPPPAPSQDTTSPFQLLQDAILNTLKGGSSNHTLRRTFRRAIGTFGAPLSAWDSSVDDLDSGSDSESNNDIPLTLIKELQFLDKRYNFKLKRSKGTVVPLTLYIQLLDPRLPRVPPLKVVVSAKYPSERPTILNFYKEYVSTPFFRDVAKALKFRLSNMDVKPTLTEIIDCWEMSVRQTVAALHKKHHNRIKAKSAINL